MSSCCSSLQVPTVPTAHSAQRTAHGARRTAHSAQRTAHGVQRTAHSAQRTARSARRAAHSVQHTAYSVRRTAHSVQRLEYKRPLGIQAPPACPPWNASTPCTGTSTRPTGSLRLIPMSIRGRLWKGWGLLLCPFPRETFFQKRVISKEVQRTWAVTIRYQNIGCRVRTRKGFLIVPSRCSP